MTQPPVSVDQAKAEHLGHLAERSETQPEADVEGRCRMNWPALSIRQPWAWFIVNGLKDIENRTWPTRFRGEFYIHASKGMTHDEYDDAWFFAERIAPGRFVLPEFGDLERGGIVGRAEIVDCVRQSNSPWFVGDYGFVLRDPSRLTFQPCKGALGFFKPAP